jgi:tRNA-Thr(GGU) m(6)t(6)A37 methyltransferase TsaA
VKYTVKSIGTVRSPIKEGTDRGWGKIISEIHLSGGLARGLQGLDQFTHAVIVFLMHASTFDMKRDIVRRPQGRDDMPLTGIFSQRARHRPNPIGITSVNIVALEGAVLRVKGLDAIDGTPVLDIKPYVPRFDLKTGARTPEWIERLMADYF